MATIRFVTTAFECLGEPEIEPQLNLLAHAQLLELETGSECGGHGVCGKDRILVDLTTQKSCLNPPTTAERSKLKQSEIERGMRLACQAFPNPGCPSFEVTLLRGAKART